MEEKQITLPQQKAMVIASFQLKENGIEPIGNPSFEQWMACLQFVKSAGRSVHFWIGDLINYGEFRWGETYREAISLTGFDIQTLRNDKWVASRIPPERRQGNLSFEHHKEVADMEEEEQEELLTKAVEQKLTRDQFRKLISRQELKQENDPQTSRQPDISPLEKALQSGEVFIHDLKQLLGTDLSSDDYSQLADLLAEIQQISTNIYYANSNPEN